MKNEDSSAVEHQFMLSYVIIITLTTLLSFLLAYYAVPKLQSSLRTMDRSHRSKHRRILTITALGCHLLNCLCQCTSFLYYIVIRAWMDDSKPNSIEFQFCRIFTFCLTIVWSLFYGLLALFWFERMETAFVSTRFGVGGSSLRTRAVFYGVILLSGVNTLVAAIIILIHTTESHRLKSRDLNPFRPLNRHPTICAVRGVKVIRLVYSVLYAACTLILNGYLLWVYLSRLRAVFSMDSSSHRETNHKMSRMSQSSMQSARKTSVISQSYENTHTIIESERPVTIPHGNRSSTLDSQTEQPTKLNIDDPPSPLKLTLNNESSVTISAAVSFARGKTMTSMKKLNLGLDPKSTELSLIRKVAITGVVSMISSITVIAVAAPLNFWILFPMDILINTICVTANFAFANDHYRWICACVEDWESKDDSSEEISNGRMSTINQNENGPNLNGNQDSMMNNGTRFAE